MSFESFLDNYAEKDFFNQVNDIFYKKANDVFVRNQMMS